MKKALVLYNSKTGTTEQFASEIGDYLRKNETDAKVKSIYDFETCDLNDVDFVFLGSWTNGLMILYQHPDRVWVEFARQLPDLSGKKIGLFTTYSVSTGSMFKRMKAHIRCHAGDIQTELKSRDGRLTESNIKDLAGFLH